MLKIFKNIICKRKNIQNTIMISLLFMVILFTIAINANSKNNGLIINKCVILEKLEGEKIGVYIDGEVISPGYIKVPKGSTLEYAIDKAKGITNHADIQSINLKRVLKNQEKIIVPTIKDTIEEYENKTNIEKININSATLQELLNLEGIGEKTAEKIIEYRKTNKFKSIEEIMEVKGIGNGKFIKIKDSICI